MGFKESTRDRVRKVLATYSEKSSVSGVNFITSTSYPFVRLFWTALLIFGLIAMTIHLVLLFAQYFKFDKQSDVDLDFNVLPLPAVTICNSNPIRRSKIYMASGRLHDLVTEFDPSRLKILKDEYVNEEEIHLHRQFIQVAGAAPPSVKFNPNDTRFENMNETHSSTTETTTPSGSGFLESSSRSTDQSDPLKDLLTRFDVDSFLNTAWGSDGQSAPAAMTAANQSHEAEAVTMFRKLDATFRILYGAEPPEVRQEMGHRLKDMLVHCDFAGKTCAPDFFELVSSNSFGNCYTIQYDKVMVDNDGPASGLQLILYLQTTDYIKGFTAARGAQVVIHEAGTIPFPTDEGFSVAAGTHTMIGLKLHDISRLGYPYGDCADVDHFKERFGVVYTRQACQKFCQAKHVLDSCGCFDIYGDSVAELLNQTQDAKPCRTEAERACAQRTERYLYENQKVLCQCENPCTEKKYKKTISARLWPAEDYAKVFVKQVCAKKSQSRECDEMLSMDGSRLREEFLKISIYYEDLNYEQLKEVPSYKLVQLVSDIGGTIGLWIGLSLLSLFEVMHLISSLFIAVFCPSVKSQLTKTRSANGNITEEHTSLNGTRNDTREEQL